MADVSCSHIFKLIIFLKKPRIFNISIDSFSLNIFSFSFLHLPQIIERTNAFFEDVWYFRLFKFSILTTNNAIELFHLNLFCYLRYSSIILSFFLYSLGEKKFVQSSKSLPFSIKSINPLQKYQHIIESYACIL